MVWMVGGCGCNVRGFQRYRLYGGAYGYAVPILISVQSGVVPNKVSLMSQYDFCSKVQYRGSSGNLTANFPLSNRWTSYYKIQTSPPLVYVTPNNIIWNCISNSK